MKASDVMTVTVISADPDATVLQAARYMRLVSGVAVAWPLSARAQQPTTPAVNIAVLTDMSGLFATLAGDGSVVAAYMTGTETTPFNTALHTSIFIGSNEVNPSPKPIAVAAKMMM